MKYDRSSCCVWPFAAKGSDGHDPMNARSFDGHTSDESSGSGPTLCV